MNSMEHLRDFAQSQAGKPAAKMGRPAAKAGKPPAPLAEVAADWIKRSHRVRGTAASDLGIPLTAMSRLLSGAPVRNEETLRRLIAALDRLDGIEDHLLSAVRAAVRPKP